MCQYVELPDREINGLRELASLVGEANLRWYSDHYRGWFAEHPDDDGCLCGLDVEATAKAAGYACWTEPGDDPMCFQWREPG